MRGSALIRIQGHMIWLATPAIIWPKFLHFPALYTWRIPLFNESASIKYLATKYCLAISFFMSCHITGSIYVSTEITLYQLLHTRPTSSHNQAFTVWRQVWLVLHALEHRGRGIRLVLCALEHMGYGVKRNSVSSRSRWVIVLCKQICNERRAISVTWCPVEKIRRVFRDN